MGFIIWTGFVRYQGAMNSQPEDTMLAKLYAAVANEDGAVTVDWVVLTGGVVALALLAIGAMSSPTAGVGAEIQASLSGVTVSQLGGIGVGE